VKPILAKPTTAVVFALLLSGCAAVGPDFKPPAALTTAKDYRPASERTAASTVSLATPPDAMARDWWKVFPSKDLDAVIRQALAANPEIASADASLDAARAELAAARGAQLPEVSASGSATQNRLNLAAFGFSGGGFPNNPEFSLYSVGGAAMFPLDAFGLARRGTESASARTEAARHQRDAAWLALTGQVASQAVTVAVLREELAQVDAIIADDRRTVSLAEQAEKAGGEAHSAGVSASAQLAADQTLVAPLKKQLDIARHALAVLTGHPPSDWTPPEFDLAALPVPASVPVALPSELVHQRPDILAAEARLHAATADVGVATARLYPNLSLSAQITQGALQPGNIFDYPATAFGLAAGATQPLFDGGRLRAGVKGAEAKRRAALAGYQQTVLRAFGQVADLMQAVQRDQEALAAQHTAAEQAAERLRLNRLAYSAGATGLFPVIDASRQLSNARLGVARAEGQLRLDIAALFVATGRGLAHGA
jgi:NodT family efflux transporter outer membrane factor (OMF) lipoprotein